MESILAFSSSLISSYIVYPIDLVKTVYQVNSYNKKIIPVNNLITNIYNNNGIKGYFRGVTPHLVSHPVFYAFYFQSNKKAKEHIITGNYFCDKFLHATIAGGIASIISNPFFVIKTRYQTDILKKNINYILYVKNMYKSEGFNGFFKGTTSALVNNTKLIIQFPLYDYLKLKTDNVFISSIIAKTIANTILYPSELIRTNQRNMKVKSSIVQTGKNIIKTNGIKGLFDGLFLYNMVSLPNFVLMMIIFENFKKLYSYKIVEDGKN